MASKATALYDFAVPFLLEEYDWTFAAARAAIASDVAAPAFDYLKKFSKPVGFRKVRRAMDKDFENVDAKVEGEFILARADILYLTYTKDVEVDKFSYQFANVVAAYIVWQLSYTVHGSHTAQEAASQQFNKALLAAISSDSDQDQDQMTFEDEDLIKLRL